MVASLSDVGRGYVCRSDVSAVLIHNFLGSNVRVLVQKYSGDMKVIGIYRQYMLENRLRSLLQGRLSECMFDTAFRVMPKVYYRPVI